MKNRFNKNKVELIFGIIVSLFFLCIMFWAVKGYAELIQNVSIGKMTFYSIMIIFLISKLENMFLIGLRDIFDKGEAKK